MPAACEIFWHAVFDANHHNVPGQHIPAGAAWQVAQQGQTKRAARPSPHRRIDAKASFAGAAGVMETDKTSPASRLPAVPPNLPGNAADGPCSCTPDAHAQTVLQSSRSGLSLEAAALHVEPGRAQHLLIVGVAKVGLPHFDLTTGIR